MKFYTVIIIVVFINILVLYNYKHFDVLFADKPLAPCPSGQSRVNGVCKPVTKPVTSSGHVLAPCPKGQTRVNGVCKSPSGSSGPLVLCSKGQIKVNGVCVTRGGGGPITTTGPTTTTGPCPSGQVRANGKCVLAGNVNRNRPCVKGETKLGDMCVPDPKTASSSPAYVAAVNGWSWDKFAQVNPGMADNPGAQHMFKYGSAVKNQPNVGTATAAYQAGKTGMTFAQFLAANPQAKNIPGIQQVFADGQQVAASQAAHGGSPYLNDPNFVGVDGATQLLFDALGGQPTVKLPPPPVVPQPHVPQDPVKHFLGVPYRT